METCDPQAAVRAKYGAAGRDLEAGRAPSCACGCDRDPVTADLYSPDQAAGLPANAVAGSLGCGNPTLLANLRPGEVALDLGSGGGLDVLLSARRVAPGGFAYGLDMTDEMLAAARRHQAEAGIANAEFLQGEMEKIPLPEAAVDVVLSNCVVNLAADKDRVLREAFRVLKPGGRLAVADVVIQGELPEPVRRSLSLWAGCIAGALSDAEYRTKLAAAGFVEIGLEATRVYSLADGERLLEQSGLDKALAAQLAGRLISAFVRARKPTRP